MDGPFERKCFTFFKDKIPFKSHLVKSNHRVLRKNKVDTYGAPVFAPYYSPIVLVTKMCTNSDEHSLYILLLGLILTD